VPVGELGGVGGGGGGVSRTAATPAPGILRRRAVVTGGPGRQGGALAAHLRSLEGASPAHLRRRYRPPKPRARAAGCPRPGAHGEPRRTVRGPGGAEIGRVSCRD